MKVFVVGGNVTYTKFLKAVELVDNVEEAEVVLFTGGSDVSPSLYGGDPERSYQVDSERDAYEKGIFERVLPTQVCLGICRGSQFLCVMNGGKLVQDVTNHAIWGTHAIIGENNQEYQITSTHHQMQYPYNMSFRDYTVKYRAAARRSHSYLGNTISSDTMVKKGEPEIVEYHKKGLPLCLAVQGHPEMMPNSPVADMINQELTTLIQKSKLRK